MGWKLTAIIVNNPGTVTDQQVLDALFHVQRQQTGTCNFVDCIYPEGDALYFASYNNNLIISTVANDLVDKFFTEKVSKAEQIFMDLFPHSEIGAFSLHSSVNYYAWTILSKGNKVRTKQGNGDEGTTCDFGSPLPEEQEFLERSFRDKDGQLLYNWDDDEPYTEDQLGEEYVSKLWARFTGVELLRDDELLENIEFRVYEVIEEEDEEDEEDEEEGSEDPPKSFWKKLFGR